MVREVVRIDEATKILKRSRTWIYAQVRTGKLNVVRFHERGPFLFYRDELEAFVAQHQAGRPQ